MNLFHFTSPHALRAIHRHGLTVGDVPTDTLINSPGLIAVWLTDSPTPEGHGLGGHLDKGRCRLDVNVDNDDPKLQRWSDWAPEQVSSDVRRQLIECDGHAWRSWFLYFGWISPDRITSVEDRNTGEVLTDWHTHFGDLGYVKGVPYWNRARWQKSMLKRNRRVLEQNSTERR